VAVRPDILTGGGPGAPARPLEVVRQRLGRRLRLDWWAARVVTLGGVVIIASILAIFLVIGSETYPLFMKPRAELVATYGAAVTPGPSSLASIGPVGVEEYQEIAYYVVPEGRLRFVSLTDRPTPPDVEIPGLAGTTVTAAEKVITKEGVRYTIGTADGRVASLDLTFEVAYPESGRTITPRVQTADPTPIDPGRKRAVQRLAMAATDGGSIVVAQVGPRELVLQMTVERKGLIGGGTKEVVTQPLALETEGEVTVLSIDGRGDDIFVGTTDGQVVRLDLREKPEITPAEAVDVASEPGAPITALGLLNGDRTVVIGDQAGGVSTWQVVGLPGEGRRRLTRIHAFDPHAGPVVSVTPSRRDKGFATADPSGRVLVHYATSGQTLLSLQAPAGELRAAAIAPKADGMVLLAADGRTSLWRLHNPHPEVNLRTLFGRVWYEGYAGPEYVWQSHGGTDDFEAKFSLTPLIFGTIKGTLYALLFAVPIALLAAVYVSEFMHPTVKGYVKPVVEVMAALPSVVLGFIAGLWLAPVLERVVPGLFVLPIVMVVGILAAAAAWRTLPVVVRGGVRPGAEVFIVTPIVIGAIWVAFWLGGVVETVALGGDYRGWLLSALGLTFDQRNSLVVGIAMGFAVIPIIFTIAEDSLANVPQHLRAGSLALGATRWQTAIRIVLPTASPGIFSAIMIGFGRAVGETMIVLMATGNTPVMDWSVFNGFRALSANIAVELPEAPDGSTHFRVLFLAALLLFCLTFALNTVAEVVRLKLRNRYRYL
jgi:phosphate transport system permease protein